MLNSNQIAHGNNGFEDTTSRECEGLHEEIFEDINKENSVIDNLESKIEDLQQENFDLKRNLGLHKHYKKIAEEDNEVVIELTRKIQTLEGEIKMLKVTMEKDEREKRNICEEIERLEQQREELKGDLENKVSRINALKKELKDQKDDIHFMNITNKKLNQDLDQDKALINRLKEQLGEKEKQPEDLIKNLTDGNKYLQEIGYLRDNLNQEKLNNHHLQGEGLNFNQFEIDHCHEVVRLPG